MPNVDTGAEAEAVRYEISVKYDALSVDWRL